MGKMPMPRERRWESKPQLEDGPRRVEAANRPVFQGMVVSADELHPLLGREPSDKLVRIVGGKAGQGQDFSIAWVEDDDSSLAYERDVCTRTAFRWDDAKREATAEGVSSTHAGKRRKIKATLFPQGETIELTCNY